MAFVRDYQREHQERDQVALKRQRGRAYDREIARAREMGLSVTAMRRVTRAKTGDVSCPTTI